ncbi:hypothetical protein [Rhizobium sp. AN6A]|uniref:hypothetical protein n=1 Tax=Rhizobium sp. AN6A TaxID=1841611 RepID=UPI002B234F2F|nr:hypothetical protein [Rhizobium sp. AN6A]
MSQFSGNVCPSISFPCLRPGSMHFHACRTVSWTDLRCRIPAAFGERATETASPLNDQEDVLAQIWQGLLGCGDIRRNDNFFSLAAIPFLHPTGFAGPPEGLEDDPARRFPASQARIARGSDARGKHCAAGNGDGDDQATLGAIQTLAAGSGTADLAHWNQGLILKPTRPLDPDRLEKAIFRVLDQHRSTARQIFAPKWAMATEIRPSFGDAADAATGRRG